MATTKATNLGHRSDVTLKGTTTTVESNVVLSDTTTINNAGSDVGLKINSTSSGHIMQLQDNGTDVMVVKDGGNIGIATAAPNAPLEIDGNASDDTTVELLRLSANQGVGQATNLIFKTRRDEDGGSALFSSIESARNDGGTTGLSLILQPSGGKVGIGTTTPESLLTLPAPFYNVSETGGMIRWQNQDTDHASDVCIQGYNVDTHGCEIYIGLNSYISTGGAVTKFHSTEECSGILLGRTGDYIFYSASASGSVSAKFQVDAIGRIYLGAYADASNTSYSTNAGANLYIGTGGDGGVIYRSTSSRRFKTNIVDTAKGLNELLTLRPVDFNSLCENDNKDKLRTGFIAEEVDNAGFDEYIQRGLDGEANGLDYAHMVALCVKSIQELSAKVSTLENATN